MNQSIGLFLIGIAVGMLLPELPIPDVLGPFLPFIIIIAGIIVLVRG